jgi:hypothetical protein
MRGGYTPDGREISKDVHRGYEWLSTDDLTSIVTYIKALPPVRNVVKRRELGFIERNVTGFFDVHREVTGYVSEIPDRFPLERGRYITDHVARCGSCHDALGGTFSSGEYLAGGRVITVKVGDDYQEEIAPPLVGGVGGGYGLRNWSKDEVTYFLRSGVTAEGRQVNGAFCPVGFYQSINSETLEELVTFLKSL